MAGAKVQETGGTSTTSTGKSNKTFNPSKASSSGSGYSSSGICGVCGTHTGMAGGFIEMKAHPWMGIKTTAQIYSEEEHKAIQGPAELKKSGSRSVTVKHTSDTCGSTVTIGFLQQVRFWGELVGSGDNQLLEFLHHSRPRVVLINSQVFDATWDVKKEGTTTSNPPSVELGGSKTVGTNGASVEGKVGVTFPLGSSFTTGGSPDSAVDVGCWATKIVHKQCGGTATASTVSYHRLFMTLKNGDDWGPSGAYIVDHSSTLKNDIRVYTVIVTPPGQSIPDDPPPPDTGGGTPTVDPNDPFIPPEFQDVTDTQKRADNSLTTSLFVPRPPFGVVLPPLVVRPGDVLRASISASSTDAQGRIFSFAATPSGKVSVPQEVLLPGGRMTQGFEIEALDDGEVELTVTYPDDSTETYSLTVQDPSTGTLPSFELVGPSPRTLAKGEPARIQIQRTAPTAPSAPAVTFTATVVDPNGALGTVPGALLIGVGAGQGEITLQPTALGTASIQFSDNNGTTLQLAVEVTPDVSFVAPASAMEIPLGTAVTLLFRLSDSLGASRPFSVAVQDAETVELMAESGVVHEGALDLQVAVQGLEVGTTVLTISMPGTNNVQLTVNVVDEGE